MSIFSYKDIYQEDGLKVLEVNILPEKYCNFDCIFCPIGKSKNKVDTPQTFDEMEASLIEFESILEDNDVDLVFINSKGEAFVNDQLENVIAIAKDKNLPIKLLSNGYLLGKAEYVNCANMCDEIIGEIKVISNEQFQKAQRPIDGYTMEEHISNMASFNKQYEGKFILEVTILKGYNDTEEAIEKMKEIIKEVSPDEILVVRMEDEKFIKKLGISDEKYAEISKALLNN